MQRLVKWSSGVLIAILGSTGTAFGAEQVTETFTNDTDLYWDSLNNRATPQNYGWSNTNNAAGAAAGEFGGSVYRSTTPNFYGFDVGTISPNEAWSFSGTLRSNTGDGALYLGYFRGASSYSGPSPAPGDANNFMGIFLNDGREVYSRIWSKNSNSDHRRAAALDVVPGTVNSFGVTYDPLGGPSGFGQMVLTVHGDSFTHNLDNGWKGILDEFTHFGVYPVNTSSPDPSIIYLDDLTFSSENPIPVVPEPASVGVLGLAALLFGRRRARGN
jgi:hypothetical protein